MTEKKDLDFTSECIDILNRIIEFSYFVQHSTQNDVVAAGNNALLGGVNWNKAKRVYNGSPRDVYENAFADKPEVFGSVEMKWAISWAKSVKIISHHGPAGTTGWAIYRNTPLKPEDLNRYGCSPFNPEQLSAALTDAMKYIGIMQKQELERRKKALEEVKNIEADLIAERKKARVSRSLTWS